MGHIEPVELHALQPDPSDLMSSGKVSMAYFSDRLLAASYAQLWREFRGLSASKIIVTAAFGGIDEFVVPPWYVENGFLVVVVADRPVTIRNCQVIHLRSVPDHAGRLLAKLPKILLPRLARRAELAIWVDANILFNPAFFSALDGGKLNAACLTFFDHTESRSPLLEGLYCMALGKDLASSIGKTIWSYVWHGKAAALIQARINACGILLWKPQTPQARSVSRIWFSLVMNGSIRDQISFPLAVRLAKAERKIMSWGLPYNHAGKDAPLSIRPHLQGNLPKMHGWQKGLVLAFDSIRQLKKNISRLKNNGLDH